MTLRDDICDGKLRSQSRMSYLSGCCLTATSHCLKHCWLIIKVFLCNSPETILTISVHKFNPNHVFGDKTWNCDFVIQGPSTKQHNLTSISLIKEWVVQLSLMILKRLMFAGDTSYPWSQNAKKKSNRNKIAPNGQIHEFMNFWLLKYIHYKQSALLWCVVYVSVEPFVLMCMYRLSHLFLCWFPDNRTIRWSSHCQQCNPEIHRHTLRYNQIQTMI